MEVPDEQTPVARAYVYSGEWVADCPRPGCGNVEFLYRPSRRDGPRDLVVPFYLCSHCGMQAGITWPDDQHAILAVLARRPLPDTRNWYPTDHPVAIRFGLPHGQTVRDLAEEGEAHGVHCFGVDMPETGAEDARQPNVQGRKSTGRRVQHNPVPSVPSSTYNQNSGLI